MPRLFVAIEPPESAREQLAAFCRGVNGAGWIEPRQIHLTLRFIGETDSVRPLQSALAKISAAPFELQIAGAGAYPPGRPPRVLWAGIAASEALTTLQQQVERSVQQCGFAPQRRPWSRHITMARFKTPPENDVQDWLEANASLTLPHFGVRSFHLFASELGNHRARHLILESFELR